MGDSAVLHSCFMRLAGDALLSVTIRINCSSVTLPDKRCLSHSMCLYQVMMTLHLLNDVANDAESTQKRSLRHILDMKSKLTWYDDK